MFYLVKNNLKIFKNNKIQFLIISLILGVSLSLFIGLSSSVSSQYSNIKQNSQEINLEDFIVMQPPNKFLNSDTNTIDLTNNYKNTFNNFINDFRQLYLKNHDESLYNLKLKYQRRSSYDMFFPESYRVENTGNKYYKNNLFTFTSQSYIENNENYKENAISQANTLGKRLPARGTGLYYHVYVTKQWAEYNNYKINSTFKIRSNSFIIDGYVNSTFYSIPIANTINGNYTDDSPGIINLAKLNPYIILNPIDYGEIYKDNSDFEYGSVTSYYVAKFTNTVSQNIINKYISEIQNFRYLLSNKYKNAVDKDVYILYQSEVNLNNTNANNVLFFPYNSKNSKITRRYSLYLNVLNLQTLVKFILTLTIFLVSLMIFAIVIRQRLSKERFQNGVLKSLGYSSFKIAMSWCGSSLIISFASFIISVSFSFLVLAINKNIISSQYLTNSSLRIDFGYMIVTSIAIFVFISLFSVLISAFTIREKALMLLKPKQKLRLNYFSEYIMKTFKFFPLTIRFSISAFISGGFRSAFFTLIILGCSSLILISIYVNQLISSTYDSLLEPFKANYTYQYPDFNTGIANTNANINYKNFNLINVNSNDFIKGSNTFYKSAKKVILNLNLDNLSINSDSSNVDNFLYFYNISSFNDPKYQDIINKYKLYLSSDSFIIQWKGKSYNLIRDNISDNDIKDISKIIERIIKDKYNYTFSDLRIYGYIKSMRSYFSNAGNDSKITLGYTLYNNKFDFPYYSRIISLTNANNPRINSEYKRYLNNTFNPLNVENKSKNLLNVFGNSSANCNIINTNNDNYLQYYKKLNLSYDKNDDFIKNSISSYKIPITISAEFANSYNLKKGDLFNNGVPDLLTNSTFVYDEANKTNIGSDLVDYIFNDSIASNKNIEFYVDNILPSDNNNEIYVSSKILSEFIQYAYNNIITPSERTNLKNKNYGPGLLYWNNISTRYNGILSKNTINYSINSGFGQLASLSQSSNVYNPDYYYSIYKTSANENSLNFWQGLISFNSVGMDIVYFYSIISAQLELLRNLFFIIFLLTLAVSILSILVLSILLIEENFGSITILRLFGYGSIQISFMYVVVNIPLIIISFFISLLFVNEFINFFVYELSTHAGMNLVNNPNPIYLFFGFIGFLILFLICMYVVRKMIKNINVANSL